MSARRKLKRKKKFTIKEKPGLQKITLDGKEYSMLPLGMFDSKESRYHVFEDSDLSSEQDINQLEMLMYHFPERAFYFFKEKDEVPNVFLDKARSENRILSEIIEIRFYKNPKFLKDFVRIMDTGKLPDDGWKRRLVEQSPEYLRFTLILSEYAKRRIQIAESIAIQKASDSNPISFKPKIWGVELDGRKALGWLRKTIDKIRRRRNPS